MNTSRITDRIYLGSSPENRLDIQQLLAGGITHVIDVRTEFDDTQIWDKNPFKGYLWNGTKDITWPIWKPQSVEWYGKSLDFAMQIWIFKKTKLYIHCKEGINRSVATTYVILRALGFSKSQAWFTIDVNRPIDIFSAAEWHPGDAEDALLQLGWV